MGKDNFPDLFKMPVPINPQRDRYVIKGGAGVCVAVVKKPNGDTNIYRTRADGALKEMTSFNPDMLDIDERRELELQLYEESYTQAEIAEMLGISQPTVAYDLKKITKK
ncbi:terminase gpP N-terminus-related DNA-binding protein [Seleniivibrio woodruffii]|uniref:Putative ATPase subunit gpP of terminase n=1 Tax=Seleniivibrio woodruffii TaxID=1078050 RepID=A0A4R1K321_9BACT|nr:ArsR family transcriptional regulator [Seleniivibrio woodruffii]TCK58458.1 putative ATPase subunit gpP of terminase [Seleniivibrio woodruffii]TVZ36831.1 putative ATPase subunit gpP of terminase [Seleniivibrio woodruffii]